jgi:hypothetical protein
MPKDWTQKKDNPIPEDLLTTLKQSVVGFRLESSEHQVQLAKMVWEGSSKRRQHKYFEGAMSFTYKELNNAFGRGGFNLVNERLNFFTQTKNWSAEKKLTRGYWFSDAVKKVREQYLKRRWRKATRLLVANGLVMKTLPQSVASKDKDGITTMAWRNARELNTVRVNIDYLNRLRRWLEQLKADYHEGCIPASLYAPKPTMETVDRLLEMTSKIIRMANTDVAGHSCIPHRYAESTSGRLYARGVNLQSSPALVKQAALSGLWEYDFSNCHFAILTQMAQKFGYQCTVISHYLANKKAVRMGIAEQAEITEFDAKVCLLALMYGARQSEWHENAIPATIGVPAAKRLYAVELFSNIYDDVNGARNVILAGWKRNQRDSLTNDFGKAMKTKDSNPPKMLAHLIQGVEAKALRTVIDLYPNDIVLLQHDGFVATKKLDSKVIMDAVKEATGYQMDLESSRIQIDPDAYFLKTHSKTI